MNTYIEINNTIVNLTNVSTIVFLKDQNRIVLNYGYGVELKKSNKTISDYMYVDFDSDEAYNNGLYELSKNRFIVNTFIKHQNGLINKNKISSIKFEHEKTRVIFNMSHAITIANKAKEEILATEFVYVSLQTGYNEYVNYVKNSVFGS